MPANPVDATTLQRWLDEAREALHRLSIGRQSVRLMIEGELVEYNRTNIQDLRSHIANLTAQLNGGGSPAALRVLL